MQTKPPWVECACIPVLLLTGICGAHTWLHAQLAAWLGWWTLQQVRIPITLETSTVKQLREMMPLPCKWAGRRRVAWRCCRRAYFARMTAAEEEGEQSALHRWTGWLQQQQQRSVMMQQQRWELLHGGMHMPMRTSCPRPDQQISEESSNASHRQEEGRQEMRINPGCKAKQSSDEREARPAEQAAPSDQPGTVSEQNVWQRQAGSSSMPRSIFSQQERDPELPQEELAMLCRTLAAAVGVSVRRCPRRLTWPSVAIENDGNCWWRSVAWAAGLAQGEWHELKQRILFRGEEALAVDHPLRQVLWQHCGWLRGQGAWADSVAIISTAMAFQVLIVVALPDRTTIFEPPQWVTEWRFQLEDGHFTPCVQIDSSDSESDGVMEILHGGGAKRRRQDETEAGEESQPQQQPDRIVLDPEYLDATDEDDTVIVSILRTRYRWHQAFRGSDVGWRFVVRRGAAVEDLRRAVARKLHIRRSAIFFYRTGSDLVDFQQVDDNQVWTFEVHLDEAVPLPTTAAGSSTDGQVGPPPTISPTEPFEPPRPSCAPELQDQAALQEEAAPEEPMQEPPEDPPEEEEAAEEQPLPPRQRLSIEMPTLYMTPPAAQRQRMRIPVHNIGPIYLIVEEGFVPQDFYQFGGLEVWQHEGRWHAYAREAMRVQTDDRHPLTDDEDGMEDIYGGGCRWSREHFAPTFEPSSSNAWLLRRRRKK